MENVKMHYMYRDAGNYKLRDSVVFSNLSKLSIEQIVDFVSVAFIDHGQFFDPDRCHIPRLSFDHYDPDLDHEWHEVELIELTNEHATHEVDIADFLLHALKVHQRWKFESCKETKYNYQTDSYS